MKEKLVRDNPGMRMRAEGIAVREATVAEMPMLLAHKLVEEAHEVLAAIEAHSHRAVTSELGDVLDVVQALSVQLGLHPAAVGMARAQKGEGDFDMRLVAPVPE